MNYFSPSTPREKAKGQMRETLSSLNGAAPVGPGRRFSFYPYLAAGFALVLLIAPLAVKGVEAVPVPLKQEFKHFLCS